MEVTSNADGLLVDLHKQLILQSRNQGGSNPWKNGEWNASINNQ
jgi:hypothetical protein